MLRKVKVNAVNISNEPHAQRNFGWLKYGNPPGDFTKAKRCGAKTRGERRGKPCLAPAMKNGRCRMHGGASTGPRTPEGLKRAQRARWKHGEYSQAEIMSNKLFRIQFRQVKEAFKRGFR